MDHRGLVYYVIIKIVKLESPCYHRDYCNSRFPGELLILGYMRSPPTHADTSVMVCYWRVFGVEFGTCRLIVSIIIYCASFAVVGDNFTPVISVFPTKSHEMGG